MRSDIIEVMKNINEDLGYSLSEEDIDKVLHYMELHDPEHATPERAVRFLVVWKKTLRKRDINSPVETELHDFYKEFIKKDLENHK